MRRRKEKDKRVLKSRYSQPPKQKRRLINNNSRNRNSYRPKKQSKTSRTTLLLIILTLIAFVAGAGAGVSMALGVFEDHNGTHVENVTVEMTSNLNQKDESLYYDDEKIDYNNNEDIAEYNLTNYSVAY